MINFMPDIKVFNHIFFILHKQLEFIFGLNSYYILDFYHNYTLNVSGNIFDYLSKLTNKQ